MDVADNRVLAHPDRVREGDLISYPGPPRRQQLAEFFGVGTAHVGVAAVVDGKMSVVEIDYSGCRRRALGAVIRHYNKVELLRLPICDHEAARIAEKARRGLSSDVKYAHDLARFGFIWANFRSIDHRFIEPAARALFPLAASIAWALGRRKTTCSGFVYQILEETGSAAQLPMRFDSALPTKPGRASRRHRGWMSHLCSPGDIWCAIPAANRWQLSASRV